MKVRIIQPYISAQALFAHQIRGLARFSSQLGPFVLAALTPDEFEVEVVNEHLERIDYDAPVDLVAITALTASVTRAYEIARKYRDKGVTVALGGIHASLVPEEASGNCDVVVVGEAEHVWPKVLSDWRSGTLKRRYRSDQLTDMADVPIPRRELDLTVGFTDKLETSRGCPFNCDFCATNLHFGSRFRARPIANVVADVESIHRHKVHTLLFTDDNIVGKHQHAADLFEACSGRGFAWVAQSSIDIADDGELLKAAAKSGCISLSIGFESLSAENLKDSRKLHNQTRKYEEQVGRLRDAGIQVLANFMFGFDHDDRSVFERTVEFVLRNKLDAYFTILTPYPGTKLRERLLQEGRILHSDWSRYDTVHAVTRPKLMEPEELEEGLRWAYQQVYPGKELVVDEPSSLHKDYRLSELSGILIELWRRRERPSGSAKRIKAVLGDAVFDRSLRASLESGFAGVAEGGSYGVGADEVGVLKELVASGKLGRLLCLEQELVPEMLGQYRRQGLFG